MDFLDGYQYRLNFAVEMQMERLGIDLNLARLCALALLPPIGEIRSSVPKRYYQALRREAWVYTRASKRLQKRGGTNQEMEDLALSTLSRYASIGRQHNDQWIPYVMGQALEEYPRA